MFSLHLALRKKNGWKNLSNWTIKLWNYGKMYKKVPNSDNGKQILFGVTDWKIFEPNTLASFFDIWKFRLNFNWCRLVDFKREDKMWNCWYRRGRKKKKNSGTQMLVEIEWNVGSTFHINCDEMKSELHFSVKIA